MSTPVESSECAAAAGSSAAAAEATVPAAEITAGALARWVPATATTCATPWGQWQSQYFSFVQPRTPHNGGGVSCVLHQYSTAAEAARRNVSARKKQRLRLSRYTVARALTGTEQESLGTNSADGCAQQFCFCVSAGRSIPLVIVEDLRDALGPWILAADSEASRQHWLASLARMAETLAEEVVCTSHVPQLSPVALLAARALLLH
jgi:hypothetical protein